MSLAQLAVSSEDFSGDFAALNLPTVSSSQVNWEDLQFAFYRLPPGSIAEHVPSRHVICVNTGNPITLERMIDGESKTVDALPVGEVGIYPAHLRQGFQWHQDAEYIHLALAPMLLEQVGPELAPNHRLELEPQLQLGSDPLIHQIAIALKTALQIDGVTSKLYADTMANALAVHLLSRYSTYKSTRSKPCRNQLSERQLKQVINYIHDHLEQDVSLAELANVAQLSSCYFSRLFKQSLGVAPHQYHIQCRVDRAKQMLLEKKLSLAEIAYAVGFANQGHLNYHFKRWAGMTPRAFLKKF